ncbi:MAG: hypothetical protein NT029_17260 [Armatimonadetes bacterium]|nr:hypothetical protein [Armatimonadota bacterium]
MKKSKLGMVAWPAAMLAAACALLAAGASPPVPSGGGSAGKGAPQISAEAKAKLQAKGRALQEAYSIGTLALRDQDSARVRRVREMAAARAYDRSQRKLYLKAVKAGKVAPIKHGTRKEMPGWQAWGPPTVDMSYANFTNSPQLRKFVDTLPGVGAANANNLGQYIPVASKVPNPKFPNDDYYELGCQDFYTQMHSDLPGPIGRLVGDALYGPGTRIRGYYDKTNPSVHQYLGPLIIARRNRPVRIKFSNDLPAGPGGDLFLPVDTTFMGAGTGPNGGTELYPQNRISIHLHGGATPWISDGIPHQWFSPAGSTSSYATGETKRDVPDMPMPPAHEGTYYYTNQQSARLMWYHDHTLGMTRLNAYAGEAAGYLIVDEEEERMINAGILPGKDMGVYTYGIPLIVQDKTFVPDPVTLADTDPTWNTAKWGGLGSLWFPHVYVPIQDPTAPDGWNPMGRWHYGPWFWPPMDVSTLLGPLPEISAVPESFMDTMLVNGTAYPKLTVEQRRYRFRILNGCNDRLLNLQLYYVDPAHPTEVRLVPNGVANAASLPAGWPIDSRPEGIADPSLRGPNMIMIGTEGGFIPGPVDMPNMPIGWVQDKGNIVVLNVDQKNVFLGPAERADVVVDFSGVPAGSKLILYNDCGAPVPAGDPRLDLYTGLEDQRPAGGPPAIVEGYGPNTRTIMMFDVAAAGSLGLPPDSATYPNHDTTLAALADPAIGLPAAYRATQDAPIIPEPGYGPVYNTTYPETYSKIQDNYITFSTDGPQTLTGITLKYAGLAYSSTPTVTIVGGGPGVSIQATAHATMSGTGTRKRVATLVLDNPGAGYTTCPTVVFTGGAPQVAATAVITTTNTTTQPMLPKTIQELFETKYGRMNATLGVELPLTNFNIQTTIPLGYIDPITETIPDGGTQVWKITHNGVDTHAVHFHLVNLQIINRVGWDGIIRPTDPEELGWKETIRMNPLEDIIVAVRAKHQDLPFGLPDSIRRVDPTQPPGPVEVVNPANGNLITVTNDLINFGWEYVWHCHLLGHEENDMMRPLVMRVNTATVLPEDRTGLAGSAARGPLRVTLTWTNPTEAANQKATAVRIERSADSGATWGLVGFVNPDVAGVMPASYADTTVSELTTYQFRIQACNGKGNSGVTSPITVTTPSREAYPLVTAVANPAAGASGFSKGPVTVTLTAVTQSANPIDSIYYSVDSGAYVQVVGATATVTFSVDGVHTLDYYATDTTPLGGVGYAQRLNLNIDGSAPTSSNTPVTAGWHTTNVSVTLTASDNSGGSGLSGITYSLNGSAPTVVSSPTTLTVSSSRKNILTYYATDLAGNVESANSVDIWIDKVAPTLTVTKGTSTLTLAATDNATGSGVAAIYYTDNGGATQTYPGTPIAVDLYAHTYVCWAVDVAGLTTATQTVTYTDRRTVTRMSVPGRSGSYGATVSVIAAVLNDSSGASVAGLTVTIALDGTGLGSAVTRIYPSWPATNYALISYQVPDALALGQHTVAAAFAGDGLYRACSGTGTLSVTTASTTTTAANVTGYRDRSAVLSGSLRRAAGWLQGKTLAFSVDGSSVGTGLTNVSGVATFSYLVPAAAAVGGHPITVRFDGDANNGASSATASLAVVLKMPTAVYVASRTVPVGSTATLNATVRDATTGISLPAGVILYYTIDGVSIGSATTQTYTSWSPGYYALINYMVPGTLTTGPHTVAVSYNGDANYAPSTGTSTLTVQ